MTEEIENKNMQEGTSCNCSDPGCCTPKPRRSWQKIAFFAVVLLAAGLITFKLLSSPKQGAACESKGCCSDTTQCTDKK